MKLSDRLAEILTGEELDNAYLKVGKIPNGFKLNYGCMYNHPVVNVAGLMDLVELFGTKEICIENYCNGSGCETCGYYSDYGHEIDIKNPTKNIVEMQELVGKEIYNYE